MHWLEGSRTGESWAGRRTHRRRPGAEAVLAGRLLPRGHRPRLEGRFPTLEQVTGALAQGSAEVRLDVSPVPLDCTDGFG